MRIMAFSFALLSIGCSAEKLEVSKKGNSPKMNIEEPDELIEPAPNLEAEAKLNPVLDALKSGTFNLSPSCSRSTKVGPEKGKISIGSTTCEVAKVNVFLGSAEIEYKVDDCVINQKPVDTSYFVFGSDKVNSYYIVSDDEVRERIFICS